MNHQTSPDLRPDRLADTPAVTADGTPGSLPEAETAPQDGHPSPETASQMRQALETATRRLEVTRQGTEARWGWRGRSLSVPVSGGLWLRLLAVSAERAGIPWWDGPQLASARMPSTVPMPAFLRASEWRTDGGELYRAELYERFERRSITTERLPPLGIDLPDAWWTSLQTALHEVAQVRTDRQCVRQGRLDWAMPLYLPSGVSTHVRSWTAAHGDVTWSNLAAPKLAIFDWETWGTAPLGWDAASLYVSSLDRPELAAKVRQVFSTTLDTDDGRVAILGAASMWLEKIENEHLHLSLREPLLRLTDRLLP